MDDNSNFEWSENRKFTLIAVNQITTSWTDKEYNDDLNMVHWNKSNSNNNKNTLSCKPVSILASDKIKQLQFSLTELNNLETRDVNQNWLDYLTDWAWLERELKNCQIANTFFLPLITNMIIRTLGKCAWNHGLPAFGYKTFQSRIISSALLSRSQHHL